MRTLALYLVAGLLALACAATGLATGSDGGSGGSPDWGRVVTVHGKVAVRENPAPDALQVRQLKDGQKVRVDFVDEGWAAVFDPQDPVRAETRAQGYVRLSELRSGGDASLLRSRNSAKLEKSRKLGGFELAEASAKGKKKDAKKAQPAQSFGEIRVADRQMAVRAGRDKDSEFLRLLNAGQRVRVDMQADGWFAVFAPDETVRDLSRAWGYGRDKYLVPEKAYAGHPLPEPADSASKEAPAKEAPAKEAPARPGQKQKTDAKGDPGNDAVGYSVLARQVDRLRPLAPVVLRVRLDVPSPPAQEVLRKVVREIWKAERHKNEDLQVEVLLPGMDQNGLAFAVARFHDDGRLKEFWWREVLLRTKR